MDVSTVRGEAHPDGRYLIEGTGGSDETIPGGSTNPTYQNQGWAKERAQRRAAALDARRRLPTSADFYTGYLPSPTPAPQPASELVITLGEGTAAEMQDFLARHGALPANWDDVSETSQFYYFAWTTLKNTGYTDLTNAEFRALPVPEALGAWNNNKGAALAKVKEWDCNAALVDTACENKDEWRRNLSLVAVGGLAFAGIAAAPAACARFCPPVAAKGKELINTGKGAAESLRERLGGGQTGLDPARRPGPGTPHVDDLRDLGPGKWLTPKQWAADVARSVRNAYRGLPTGTGQHGQGLRSAARQLRELVRENEFLEEINEELLRTAERWDARARGIDHPTRRQ